MLWFVLSALAVAGPPDVDGDGYPVTIDCNDADGTIHPLAPEIPYDGIDQDCTGADLCDADGDGAIATQCGGDDCADDDAARRPGAIDVPGDAIDQDCDGADAEPRCDLDEDGVLAPGCGGEDCNDLDAAVYPGAPDAPDDGVDQDCDGQDGCETETWFGGGTCQTIPVESAFFLMFMGILASRLRRRRSP